MIQCVQEKFWRASGDDRNRLCNSFLFWINFCLQYKASKSRGEKLHKVFRIWNYVESVIYTGGMKHVGTGSSQEISRTFPAQVRVVQWEARIQVTSCNKALKNYSWSSFWFSQRIRLGGLWTSLTTNLFFGSVKPYRALEYDFIKLVEAIAWLFTCKIDNCVLVKFIYIKQ